MRFIVPTRTRVLVVMFFVLYGVVVAGLAIRSADDAVTAQEVVAAVLGGIVVGVIFVAAALRQRSDLRSFVARLLGDLPQI